MSKKNKKEVFRIGDVYDPEIASLDKQSRVDNLEGIAYAVQESTYTRNLDDPELAERKTELSEVCIKLNELEERKKDLVDEMKELMKTPKGRNSELLEIIKHRSERREGTLYLIDDQESGLMYSFDSDAICVDIRPLTKEERQTSILSLTKNNGTDGE